MINRNGRIGRCRGVALAAMLCVLGLAGSPAPAAEAADRLGLEDVLHPNTILFVRAFDLGRLGESMGDTALGRVRQHPEVAEFLELLSVRNEEFVDRVTEESGLDRDTVAALFRAEVSFAFRGFGGSDEGSLFYYALSFPEPLDHENVFTILEAIAQRMLNPQIVANRTTIDGVPILNLTLPENYYFALLDNLLVMTRDEKGLTDMIGRFRDPRGNVALSETPTFRKVAAGAGVRPGGAFYFLNTRLAMPVLLALTSDETVALLDALGLPSVEGIGFSAVYTGEGLRDTLYLYAPRERTGILRVLTLERGAERAAASVAEDAGVLLAARVNLVHLYREVPRLIDSVREAWPVAQRSEADGTARSPALSGFRALIGEDQILGVPAEEVLATLGDSIVLAPAPAGMAVRFDHADAAAFEAVIARMEDRLGKTDGILSGSFTSLPEGRHILRYYNQSGHPVPLAPSYVRLDDQTVLIAAHPQVLKSILRHDPGKTLAAAPDFRRVAAGMPEGLGGFIYFDSTGSYARVYDALMPFLNALTAYPDLMAVDPGLLPPGEELTPFFFGTGLGMHNTQEGLTLTAYSPMGLGGAFVYALDRLVVNNPATMSVAGGALMHLFGSEDSLMDLTGFGLEDAAAEPAPAAAP